MNIAVMYYYNFPIYGKTFLRYNKYYLLYLQMVMIKWIAAKKPVELK